MQRRTLLLALAVAGFVLPAAAKEWDPRQPGGEYMGLLAEAKNAVTAFRLSDPTLSPFFSQAYGYAIFPKITKGGVLVGGAHGRGLVYRDGQPQAQVVVTQGSVGLQAGAKTYRQIMFFRDEPAYQRFLGGQFKLGGQAEANVAGAGAGDRTAYSDGVAVFILDKKGAMAAATVGGQNFRIEPLNYLEQPAAAPAPQ